MKQWNVDRLSDAGQTFYVDGHKVTVRYSEDSNPRVVQRIRDILLYGAKSKRVDFLHS